MVEGLFKLVKISGSIETILFGETKIFNNLSEDLCKAIGESISIKHLNFDGPVKQTPVSSNVIF